jgi:hypothetical protein
MTRICLKIEKSIKAVEQHSRAFIPHDQFNQLLDNWYSQNPTYYDAHWKSDPLILMQLICLAMADNMQVQLQLTATGIPDLVKLDNFRNSHWFSWIQPIKTILWRQDKGLKAETINFLGAIVTISFATFPPEVVLKVASVSG